jgi:hypothetical protein
MKVYKDTRSKTRRLNSSIGTLFNTAKQNTHETHTSNSHKYLTYLVSNKTNLDNKEVPMDPL